MTPNVRRIEPRDEPRWRELFDAYTRFYEREPDEPVTRHTWQRMLDAGSPLFGIVAEHQGQVVGIANCVMHENTATIAPVCYLQDLFVDPKTRANGVGKAMIDWLVAEMKSRGWARLYWMTRHDNPARKLYDRFGPADGFVRYRLTL